MKISALTVLCLSLGLVSQGHAQVAPANSPVKPVEKTQGGGAPKAATPPKPKPKAKPAKPAGPKKYVIKSGDNPWLIANHHGVSLDELLKVNKIADPKNLKIGDVLILPAGASSKTAPGKEKGTAAPVKKGPQSGDGWELYTIKSGDNPWTISKRLNVDHQKILTLNEGLNFRDLKIGQQIKVPKKS
ncbi:MAG: LysM peptidoglycan-binding domain-containing protein [Verrucomicrobiales bacterium]|nr:LysM peptidoglycan-binding domain-containing protein [Verrucomicrobiales bacterium]